MDIHAEATADKYLLAHHLKGRVSAVLGTHTHVPTADEQILPGGTAFICDVGMTGPYDSILGRRIDRVLPTTVTFMPSAFDVADRRPAAGRRHRRVRRRNGPGHRDPPPDARRARPPIPPQPSRGMRYPESRGYHASPLGSNNISKFHFTS